MLAAVLRGPHQSPRIEDVAIPTPGPRDLLIRVMASGLCSTDIHIAQGKVPVPRFPLILGHQCAGVVEAVGNAVEDFRAGDRVAPHLDVTCHHCFYCTSGMPHLCEQRERLGFELNGTHAQYVCMREDAVLKLPERISFEQGAILSDAVATMYHAIVKRGRVQVGENVILYGIGGLGMQGVQLLKLCGARVLVADRHDAKLDFAISLGADAAVNTLKEDLVQKAMQFTDGRGADVVVDNIGGSKSVLQSSNMVRPAGRILLVGNSDPMFEGSSFDILMREITIIGCRASNKQDFIDVVKLVSAGHLNPVVSKVFRLPELDEAFVQLEAGWIIGRAVLVP